MENPYYITDSEQLTAFIKDLKNAERQSKKTGGGYSVYRQGSRDPTQCVVAIEFCYGRRSRSR